MGAIFCFVCVAPSHPPSHRWFVVMLDRQKNQNDVTHSLELEQLRNMKTFFFLQYNRQGEGEVMIYRWSSQKYSLDC